MRKKVEVDEGESDAPLDKPSLLSLQNTAIKVRRCPALIFDVLVEVNAHSFLSEIATCNWIG